MLALAVFRNGNEISSVNMVGMFVCLLGIFAHVIRKALKADEVEATARRPSLAASFDDLSSSEDLDEHEDFFRRVRSRVPENIGKEGLPLLNDSDEESDAEIMQLTRKKSRSVSSDDYYFRDNRTWTSVRDRHLEMRGLEAEDEAAIEAPILDIQGEEKASSTGLLLSD